MPIFLRALYSAKEILFKMGGTVIVGFSVGGVIFPAGSISAKAAEAAARAFCFFLALEPRWLFFFFSTIETSTLKKHNINTKYKFGK